MSTQDRTHDKLLNEIEHFNKKLHHVTQPNDKSAPAIDPDVEVKKLDRAPFLKEVEKGTHLHHVDVKKDRSAPKIEEDVHIKQNERRYPFLSEVEKQGGHIGHSSS